MKDTTTPSAANAMRMPHVRLARSAWASRRLQASIWFRTSSAVPCARNSLAILGLSPLAPCRTPGVGSRWTWRLTCAGTSYIMAV